jgi:hypothetical protein
MRWLSNERKEKKMPYNGGIVNRDGRSITTSSPVLRLTPQQEKQRQDVDKLSSSLPANQQRSFKALGLYMSEQILLKPISEADVRKIVADNMGKVAEITRPKTAEMLLDHTELLLSSGMLTQIEQMAAKTGISETREIINALREELLMLQDELADWPDGEIRTITYGMAVRQSDGSWKLTKQTKTMTKEEIRVLISTLEGQISEMSEVWEADMLKLQDAMNKQARLYQVFSNTLKMMKDTAKAIIRNMR